MKKISLFFTITLVITFFIGTTACFAYQGNPPRRVAILPIINQMRLPQPFIESYLEDELDKSLHIPLNGTLNILAYIPEEEILAALPTDFRPLGRTFDARCLIPAAETLHADLIVAVVITHAHEYRIPEWEHDILDSAITLKLFYYDKAVGSIETITSSESYRDEYTLAGTLLDLGKTASNRLFAKVDFKKNIFPLSPVPKNENGEIIIQ